MEEKILEIVTQNAVMLGRLSEKVDRNAELIAQNTLEIAKNREAIEENRKEIAKNRKAIEENKKAIEENRKEIAKNREIIENHENRIDSIEKYLIIIEDAVTNRIPALFDKTSWQDDRFDRDEGRIKKLEEVTEYHSLRITSLEMKVEENS